MASTPPKPTVIYDNLPEDEAHGWKFIAIGPDNKLYVPVGQPGNNVLHDDAHGQIRRMNLDGSGAEVYALGVRNSVGFDWNPENKQMYFTDNGRDWLSEDVPQDELNRVSKKRCWPWPFSHLLLEPRRSNSAPRRVLPVTASTDNPRPRTFHRWAASSRPTH